MRSPVFLVSECKTSDGAGNADRFVGLVMNVVGIIPGRIDEHVRRGALRGRLTKIDGGGASVGKANHHESTAANVAGDWIGDGEREPGRDRGVDGIASGGENVASDFTGDAAGGDDHAVWSDCIATGGRECRCSDGGRRRWTGDARSSDCERDENSGDGFEPRHSRFAAYGEL